MYIRKKIENETEQLWFRIKKIIKKKRSKPSKKRKELGKGLYNRRK